MQLLNDKHGFSTIESVAMQLHPSLLQAMKSKIPELEKVILFLQKSKRGNSQNVYGSSGANGWPLTLKKRMN